MPQFPDKQQSATAFAPVAGIEPAIFGVTRRPIFNRSKLHRAAKDSFYGLIVRILLRDLLSYSLSENRARFSPDAETNPKKPNYVFKIQATTFDHRADI